MWQILSTLLRQNSYHLKNEGIAYPDFGLYKNNHCAIFAHGHFVEALYHLMSDLATTLSPGLKPPADIGEIEAQNFAWIDFF